MTGLVLALMSLVAPAGTTVRLDVPSVVARALQVSEVTAAADFAVGAAKARCAAADAGLLPVVSASGSASHRSGVPPYSLSLPWGSLELFPDIRETFASGLRLDYPLFTGGAISGARRAARHEVEVAMRRRDQARADVALGATVAYWEAVRARAGVVAAEAQERRALAVLRTTEALAAAGMATPADVAGARAQAASARVQVVTARSAEERALSALRSLLRLEGAMLELTDSLGGPLPPPPDTLSVLQARALEGRPERHAAVARVRALRAHSRAARAGTWPRVSAVAQWDYARPNPRVMPPRDEWEESWSVGLLGSWVILDGGKTRAEARALEASAQAAARELAELERGVLLEVEMARHDLLSSLSAARAADEALTASVEREREVRLRHGAGLASTTELLQAEADLSAAERLVIETRAGAQIASARLRRAVGE